MWAIERKKLLEFDIITLRWWVQHLVPHIRWYRKRNWQWDVSEVVTWNHNTNYHLHLGIHINNINVWPKDSTVNYKQEINCCIAWCSISTRWSHLRDAFNTLFYTLQLCEENSYLNKKKNYGISNHGLWLNSFDIILVDLKSRDFHTLCRWGRGTAMGQIYI